MSTVPAEKVRSGHAGCNVIVGPRSKLFGPRMEVFPQVEYSVLGLIEHLPTVCLLRGLGPHGLLCEILLKRLTMIHSKRVSRSRDTLEKSALTWIVFSSLFIMKFLINILYEIVPADL